MAEGKRRLFRKEAIERMSNLDDLELLMPLTESKEWLLLAVTGCVLLLFVFWLFVGHVPTTVTARGILLRPNQVFQAQTSVAGRILELRARAGDRIRAGDALAIMDLEDVRKRIEENRRNLQRLIDQDARQRDTESQQIALQSKQDLAERNGLETQRGLLRKNLDDANELRPVLVQRAEANRRLVKENLLGFAAKDVSDAEVAVRENEAKIRTYSSQLSQIDSQFQMIETRSTALVRQISGDKYIRRDAIEQIRRIIDIDTFQMKRDGVIRSQYSGTIAEMMVVPGQVMSAGARLLTVEIEQGEVGLLSLSYFAIGDGKKIEPGMDVQVIPDGIERERFGGITGKVYSVSPTPIQKDAVVSTIGNTDVVQSLIPSGGFIEVRSRLLEDGAMASGYRWSSSRGPKMQITAGLTHAVRVRVEGRAPISYLLPVLREVTGVY